jgi:hypothetical protein
VEFVKITLERVLSLPKGRPQEVHHPYEKSYAPELDGRACSKLYLGLLLVCYLNARTALAMRYQMSVKFLLWTVYC